MISKKQNIIYHILSCVFLLGFIAIGLFVQQIGYIRLVESIKDLGTSVVVYFCKVFKLSYTITPSVLQSSKVTFNNIVNIDFDTFKNSIYKFFVSLISFENFLRYISTVLLFIVKGLPFILIFLGIGVVFYVLFKFLYFNVNIRIGDTKSLAVFKDISGFTYQPVKRCILSYVNFLKENKLYLYVCLFIFLVNVNVISILIDTVAYLLFFCVTFEIDSIFPQIYKLFLDVCFALKSIPLLFWLGICLIFLDCRRKDIGYRRLERKDAKNPDFSQHIAILINGKMGTGKTTLLVLLALSIARQQRKNAYNQMREIYLRFPFFPYIEFEKLIEAEMERHSIYSAVGAGEFVESFCHRFLESPCAENIFGYDYKRYGLEYDDGLKIRFIFDELINYAKLYLIYIMDTSYIQANLAIREDFSKIDVGNFPKFNYDFFRKSPMESKLSSNFCHILDLDCLRLGKKVVEDNRFANYAEFGVFCITEVAKDRGNQNDHKKYKSDSQISVEDIKKIINKYKNVNYKGKDEIVSDLKILEEKYKSEKANPLNDYCNLMIKMFRHLCTIDGVCYCAIIMDEQRASSLNADLLELTCRLSINSRGIRRNVLPFYWLDKIFHDAIVIPFNKLVG